MLTALMAKSALNADQSRSGKFQDMLLGLVVFGALRS
jgi:hypothetical protein